MELKFRFATLDGPIETKDGKKRVAFSFSSESPCLAVGDGTDYDEGKLFYEVLDHSDERSADLSLLKNRGAFLDEHHRQFPIGVILEAKIDTTDRKGRAVAEMDTDGLGKERCRQMESQMRPNISIGYKTKSLISETTHADGKKIRTFAWEVFEASSVALPRDGKVGVFRSVDLEKKPEFDSATILEIAQQTKKFMDEVIKPVVALDETKIRSEASTATATSYKTRAKNISAIADALNESHGDKSDAEGKPLCDKIRKLAAAALQSDESEADFKIRCMTEVLAAKPAKVLSLRASGMSEKDEESYSLMKGIQSAAENKRRGMEPIPDAKSIEGEFHNWIVKEQDKTGGFGYEQSGFVMPFDYQIRTANGGFKTRKQRDMQAEVFATGGAFVPTQLVTPPIEILRNMEVLDKLGVRHMDGLTGNIVIPRQDAASTAYAVSEIGALTASGQILGQLALSPHRVGAQQTYSKQFVFQSSPDAETFLRDDLFKVIALKRDQLGLTGQGAGSEPLGVMNTPGVQSIVFGATPTWIKIVAMETAILSANVVGELAYVSTPATRGSLKTVAVALTGATTIGGAQNAIWVGDTMNGYKALASNQIPNNQVILGHWDDLISASWNGFDVVVDYVTKAGNAEIVITINIWCDFAIRHPQAFDCSADSGAQ